MQRHFTNVGQAFQPDSARPRQAGKPDLPARGGARRRSGVVLVVVLIVIVVLSLSAFLFSEAMTSENLATDSYTRSAQTLALAESGIDFAAAVLSNPDTFTNTLNSNPFNNPAVFQSLTVQDGAQPHFQGHFSIIAPLGPDDAPSDTQPYRFGVIDEGGKINLNAMMKVDSSGQMLYNMLLQLPNMTEDIANSILDWLDADENPRENGAESDYYSSLTPPYQAKNGPLDSLEELLLVKGVTPQLLFGNDRNRNGILDPDEDDGSGLCDLGWSAYLTVSSRTLNLDSNGNPRIYVNSQDLNTLYTNLTTAVGADLANYIVAYRLYGGQAMPTAGSGSGAAGSSAAGSGTAGSSSSKSGGTSGGSSGSAGGGGASASNTTTPKSGSSSGSSGGSASAAAAPARLSRSNLGNFQQGRPQSISSLYALINSRVAIPGSTPQAQPTYYPSPLNDPSQLQQLLPTLLDEVTTSKNTELPARININSAPAGVLAALPGLSDSDVQAILDNRPSPDSTDPPDAIFQSPAWLIARANFTPQKVQALDQYITARSQVYRVQSVGYFNDGPVSRIEAVIDTNAGRPRVVYWRDLTALGKGFKLPTNP
jgi:type II secretory pathway component PulK